MATLQAEKMEKMMMEEAAPAKAKGLKKYFRDFYTGEDPHFRLRYQVLDVAPLTKQEIYLAIEEVNLVSSERKVFARLCLPVSEVEGETASYRSEEEREAPVLTNCPLRILNLLTPTTDFASLQWRLKCYEKQIAEAQAALAETRERYEQTHFDSFRDYVRKSAEMMVERRFLILHQALSAEQTTRALLQAQI